MAGRFTDRKKKKLLSELRQGRFLRTAAKNAGVHRSTVEAHREKDPAFNEAVEDAIAEGTGLYEDELQTRVFDGEERTVFNKQGDSETYFVKSDRLLEFALKARDRKTYGDQRTTELTGKDGGPIQTSNDNTNRFGNMTPDEIRAQVAQIIEQTGAKEADDDG